MRLTHIQCWIWHRKPGLPHWCSLLWHSRTARCQEHPLRRQLSARKSNKYHHRSYKCFWHNKEKWLCLHREQKVDSQVPPRFASSWMRNTDGFLFPRHRLVHSRAVSVSFCSEVWHTSLWLEARICPNRSRRRWGRVDRPRRALLSLCAYEMVSCPRSSRTVCSLGPTSPDSRRSIRLSLLPGLVKNKYEFFKEFFSIFIRFLFLFFK